jgi:hypothetical protein
MSSAIKTAWQFKPLGPSLVRTDIDPGPLPRIFCLYRATQTVGAVYLARGQEAIAAGVGLLPKENGR